MMRTLWSVIAAKNHGWPPYPCTMFVFHPQLLRLSGSMWLCCFKPRYYLLIGRKTKGLAWPVAKTGAFLSGFPYRSKSGKSDGFIHWRPELFMPWGWIMESSKRRSYREIRPLVSDVIPGRGSPCGNRAAPCWGSD